METIVLHIPTDKKDFFLSLLKELSFVTVEEPQKAYISAIEKRNRLPTAQTRYRKTAAQNQRFFSVSCLAQGF